VTEGDQRDDGHMNADQTLVEDAENEEARVSNLQHKSSGKLKTSLEKRQKKLWKKRVTGVTDHSLERKLAAIAIQEQCLEEWTYKNYSYNALAEHMLLNE
jgi:hypothetical protein